MPSQTLLFLRVPGVEDGRGGAVPFWFLHSKNQVSSEFQTGNLRLSGAESPGQGRDWEYLCSVVRALPWCKTWSRRLGGVGVGKQNKVLTVSRRVVLTGREAPPHESGSAPPHRSQLLPGAGEGSTGRPGPLRTPGKGRKAGADVVGRK